MTLELFFQTVVNATYAASYMALIAVGLVLIFGVMGVINFAHGELYMAGAYMVVALYADMGINFFLAVAIGLLFVGLLGLLMEYGLFRPLRDNPLGGLIASTMISLCEGLLYAHKSGLDVETVLKSVSVGAAGSKCLDIYAPRILQRNFEPGFYVEHFIKDMGIALAEAERMNLCLPGLALAKQLYEAVRAQGYGRKGTQALLLALEHLNNVKRS